MRPSSTATEEALGTGLVLGTAGHIDHGKTALIRALTGVDTDRLPEEKERGITIELGFAPLELADDLRLSVIDVPGHERLVRTMVSGATGIDLVLLVVAADEGIMPQTREHVAICELLGIHRGVIALSKTDLVDEEMQELATEELRDFLADRALRDAPILPVSSQTGAGIDALREVLTQMARNAEARTPRAGPARMGIDRVFPIRGFGTVVTGTLIGSGLSTGDKVEIQPGGIQARIRGLQTHGRSAEYVAPGSRCAVNLQGVDATELSRGEVLTRPDTLAPTHTADVRLDWLDGVPAVEGMVAVEFLSGTSKRRARLAPVGIEQIEPGQQCFARIHIDGDPVPLLPGDRFVVRGFSRVAGSGGTLGGGLILDVAPPHRRRSDPDLVRELGKLAERDPRADIEERIRRAGFTGSHQSDLKRETGIEATLFTEILGRIAAEAFACNTGEHWIYAPALEDMQDTLCAALDSFHAAEPLRPGMPRGTLRGQLPGNVAPEIADLALTRLETAARIHTDADLVRGAKFAPTLDTATQLQVERIRQEARKAGLEPLGLTDWAKKLGADPSHFRDLLAHLEREGTLVRAPGDFWFDQGCVDELEKRLKMHLEEHGEIATPDYKAMIGTTRRTAVPLMELFDDRHITRRRDNKRVPFKS